MDLKKPLLILSVLGVVALAAAFAASPHRSRAAGNSVPVTVSDLTQAGYASVTPIAPAANGRFAGPTLYFSVSDKVSSPSSEAPNVVMVSDLPLPYLPSTGALFKYSADSHDFSVSGAPGKEATLADGRIAVNFLKSYNYVVVIGPNQQKVEALAIEIAGKIQ